MKGVGFRKADSYKIDPIDKASADVRDNGVVVYTVLDACTLTLTREGETDEVVALAEGDVLVVHANADGSYSVQQV